MLKNPIYSNLQFLKSEIAWFARKSIDFLVRITASKRICEINQKKKLLIIRTDTIGDFVIFTGVLQYFREIYPSSNWEITLLGSKEYRIIAEFVQSDIISPESVFDKFIPIDRFAFSRNLIYRFQFQKKLLQNLYYDVVIYPVYSRNRDGDQLMNIINSPEKIAIDGDCSNIPFSVKHRNDKTIYTKIIKLKEGWLSEAERNVDFIKQLGIKKSIDGVARWKIPSEIVETSINLVKIKGIESDFAVVCPGAFNSYRVWSPEKVATVIDYLWCKYKITTLICGSPKEKIISLEIQKNLKSSKVICLCGKTNLIQLSAIMSYAKLCITMDSGPSHIAVAVNAPLICVIGGGHYKRFFPYGDPSRFRAAAEELDCFYCNWKCKFNTPLCVKNISVETVIKEIEQLMNRICNQTI
ncbi:glycosyltransferase family 9 protein [Cronbergia sp. UHCC 0137]|uniref:glycosyltransferase family 9 protein n=1 Tax=Cronbergia sp. UHCC 0137 TaxID=3110239 RepID=UPI002B20B35B|nr:glycosyltransferase family 9 protein [Cronbergia sp. UHCC 0137]MEA5618349.1 glycosyltransferase family 9 protein [Cronbergia sp. UHCC 0137]